MLVLVQALELLRGSGIVTGAGHFGGGCGGGGACERVLVVRT